LTLRTNGNGEQRKWILAGIVSCITFSTAVSADEEKIADTELLEFLEYLGTQDGNDNEWNKFFDSLPDPEQDDAADSTDQEASPDAPA